MTTATATQQRPAGRPGPASPAPAGTPGWGPLLVVLAGTFMALLDFFIVNVACRPSSPGCTPAGPRCS